MAQPRLDYGSFEAFVDHGLRTEHAVEHRPLACGARMYRFTGQKPAADPTAAEMAIHLAVKGGPRVLADAGIRQVAPGPGPAPSVRAAAETPLGKTPFDADTALEVLSLSLSLARVQSLTGETSTSTFKDMFAPDARAHRCPVLAHLLLSVWNEAESESAAARAYQDAALATVVARLRDLASPDRAAAPAQLVKGGLAPWQIKRAKEFIEENLTRSLTVRDLADLCSLSPFHFARAFHQSVGLPPHAYLTSRRLEIAARLLLETTQSVTEIALAVGYAETSHLSRAFKRVHGLGPAEFRRRR